MSGSVPSAALEALLYLILAFGPFAFGCVEPWARATLECLCYALAFGVFLRGRPAGSAAGSYLWTVPAAFAVLALAQATTSALPGGPRPPWPFSVSPTETEAAARLWAAYACLAWAVPRVLIDHEAARRFAKVFLVLGCAVAVLGFAQSWTSVDRIYWTRRTAKGVAPFGPYYNMDHAAGFLLLCLCFAGGLFVSRFADWNAGRPSREWARAQAGVAAALMLVFAALAACRSQAAMLALALGGLFVVFLGGGFHGRRRRLLQAGAALAAAVVVIALVLRVATAGEASGALIEKAVRSRMLIYADAWRWWLDTPWTGTGLGTFDFQYPAYQDSSLRAKVSHAHSDWIETALEAGLLGVFLALTGVVLPVVAGARSWWSGRSREMRGLLGGGLAAGACAAAHSLVRVQLPDSRQRGRDGRGRGVPRLRGLLARQTRRAPVSRPPRRVGSRSVRGHARRRSGVGGRAGGGAGAFVAAGASGGASRRRGECLVARRRSEPLARAGRRDSRSRPLERRA